MCEQLDSNEVKKQALKHHVSLAIQNGLINEKYKDILLSLCELDNTKIVENILGNGIISVTTSIEIDNVQILELDRYNIRHSQKVEGKTCIGVVPVVFIDPIILLKLYTKIKIVD